MQKVKGKNPGLPKKQKRNALLWKKKQNKNKKLSY